MGMSDDKLHEIIELEEQGYRATAVRRLSRYLKDHPNSADGWYYMARFAAEPRQQYSAIQNALKYDPTSEKARDFLEILLEEHPNLEPKRMSRGIKIALAVGVIGLIVLAGILVGISAGFFEEPTREVIIVIPTASPTPVVTDQPFVVATDTPTEVPAITPPAITDTVPAQTSEPVLTIIPLNTQSVFVSATPAPTDTNQPLATQEVNNPSARLMLLSSIDETTDQTIHGLIDPAYLRLEMTDAPVTSEAEAQSLAGQENAALVVYGTNNAGEFSLHLYAQEDTQQTQNRPELLALSRLSSPWHMTLDGGDWQNSLKAALGYLTYQHQEVIDALGTRFDNVRGVMGEDDIRLAAMLAYSHQAVGNHQAALPLYDLLIGYTEDTHIKANRAWAIAETGDYESAVTLYLSLMDKHPDPSFIQTNIGEIYARFPESANSARLAFDEAIQLNPRAPRPHIGKGRLLVAQNDYNAALAEFDNAVSVAPDYTPGYYARAQLRATLGLLDDAYSDITYAINLQPGIAAYYLLQGQILYEKKEWQLARQSFESYLQRGTPNPEIYTFLAEAYVQMTNFDAAIDAANKALELNAAYAPAWLQRATAYWAKNDTVSALKDFDQGLQNEPENVDLLVARCTLYADLGDDGAAALDCDAALTLDPVNGQALEQRGLIRARAGDRPGAASDFQEAIIYFPEADEAYFYLGVYALQERRYEDAIKYLTENIRLSPEPGPAYAARGVAYRISGQWQQAINDLEQALLLVPEDEYSYYELGMAKRALADIAYEAGNAQQALIFYQDAQSAFTSFIERTDADNPYLDDAQQGINYVNAAMGVIQRNEN